MRSNAFNSCHIFWFPGAVFWFPDAFLRGRFLDFFRVAVKVVLLRVFFGFRKPKNSSMTHLVETNSVLERLCL